MKLNMKKKPLLILAAISLVCSRATFFLINDPEGPNLLIVAVLAAVIFAVFLAVVSIVKRYN